MSQGLGLFTWRFRVWSLDLSNTSSSYPLLLSVASLRSFRSHPSSAFNSFIGPYVAEHMLINKPNVITPFIVFSSVFYSRFIITIVYETALFAANFTRLFRINCLSYTITLTRLPNLHLFRTPNSPNHRPHCRTAVED